MKFKLSQLENQDKRSDSKDTGYGTCLAVDTTSMANGEYYINPGQFRDFRGEIESNLFVFVNHELDNGSEFLQKLVTIILII